jgi:hypothetical protein
MIIKSSRWMISFYYCEFIFIVLLSNRNIIFINLSLIKETTGRLHKLHSKLTVYFRGFIILVNIRTLLSKVVRILNFIVWSSRSHVKFIATPEISYSIAHIRRKLRTCIPLILHNLAMIQVINNISISVKKTLKFHYLSLLHQINLRYIMMLKEKNKNQSRYNCR